MFRKCLEMFREYSLCITFGDSPGNGLVCPSCQFCFFFFFGGGGRGEILGHVYWVSVWASRVSMIFCLNMHIIWNKILVQVLSQILGHPKMDLKVTEIQCNLPTKQFWDRSSCENTEREVTSHNFIRKIKPAARRPKLHLISDPLHSRILDNLDQFIKMLVKNLRRRSTELLPNGCERSIWYLSRYLLNTTVDRLSKSLNHPRLLI